VTKWFIGEVYEGFGEMKKMNSTLDVGSAFGSSQCVDVDSVANILVAYTASIFELASTQHRDPKHPRMNINNEPL
jgi:hypothetical protein